MCRVNTITSTSHMNQPSTMWGRTGGVWVCGGLIPSLQHHHCINRQLCGGRTGGVWVCGGLIPSLQHHNCINRQLCGVELGCMGVWRVNTVTATSQLHQPSTMWGRTGGVWVCGGLILSLQHHNCINLQLCGVELGV